MSVGRCEGCDEPGAIGAGCSLCGADVRGAIDMGRWRTLAGYGAFAHERDVPLFVQFSGGRTSGFMTAMSPDHAIVTFQNTGREHEKTLEFVRNVGDALGREIVWLEFRPPKAIGDPPKKFLFERVDFRTANRKGEPFIEFMRSINAYREACGNPPIAPWVRGRICTVHLKHRVLDHYVRSLGIHAHDRFIGLRADEPTRVAGLRRQETRDKGLLAPLYVAGITRETVLEFWQRQSFDLDLPEYDGNCDGCFLKDQSDISRAVGSSAEKIEWWGWLQDKYPRFGGVTMLNYRDLAAELPTRLMLEKAFREGRDPVDDGRLTPRRFRLVMIQEKKRFEHGPNQFSCSCEASMDPEEEEDQ